MSWQRIVLLSSVIAVFPSAPAADPPRPVTVAESTLAPAKGRLELTGSVTANRRSQLSSRTAGLVASVVVDAGRRVRKGDPLLELDRDLAEIGLAQIRVELEQARIELADAERLVKEVSELAARGGFAKSEAESRVTAASVKRAAVRLLEEREKLQVEMIDRHRLVAPFDGVIASKLTEEGEWVQTGTPVMELVELDRLRFDVRAPQEYFAAISPDLQAKVALDAYPGREVDARVSAVVPVKDGPARTFLVRLDMEPGVVAAAPGMSGRAVFSLRSADGVVQIPRDAVVRLPDGGAKVWIAEKGDSGTLVVRSQDVVPGTTLGPSVEVVRGLEAGVTVVVRGNEGLREGQAVEVLPESGAGEP